nr:dentin sialophosphoprotein [Ipomoea batatas]
MSPMPGLHLHVSREFAPDGLMVPTNDTFLPYQHLALSGNNTSDSKSLGRTPPASDPPTGLTMASSHQPATTDSVPPSSSNPTPLRRSSRPHKPDRGDLCDIYEERQSEEDGNNLLVESGSAWRKMNVQRVLDESTKNHVKMLSEEAERKSKSRKTIILDPRNPSTKSQVKARATVEGNLSKMTLQQPPHKKRKVEPPPVQAMPHAARGPPNKVSSSGTQGMPGGKKSTSSKPSDLQCMLITFLMDNQSNGMTLKALEKAVGDAFPNSARKIKPILKKVATFQAPGRYFLKPGVKIENFMKSTIGSGSSREVNHPTLPTHNKHELPVQKSSLSIRADTNALEGQQQLNSKRDEAPTFLEKVDLVQLSPDGSGNKSRSRSPVDNGASRSTSDSESDIPSNSEEASDDDLDIMIRDDDRLVKYKPDGTKRQKAGNMNQQKISGGINQVVAKNSNKVGVNSKNQHNVTERSLEAYGDNHGKVSTGEAERHDTEQGVCLPVTKECKMQETNLVTDLNDRQKDTLMRSNDGCQERRHSSPDEISCSFSKYEKEDPEFRVPINGFSQYKEYVEEYHEKYEIYCLLKKTLESYRFEFFELGKDLDICKRKGHGEAFETDDPMTLLLHICKDRYNGFLLQFLPSPGDFLIILNQAFSVSFPRLARGNTAPQDWVLTSDSWAAQTLEFDSSWILAAIVGVARNLSTLVFCKFAKKGSFELGKVWVV